MKVRFDWDETKKGKTSMKQPIKYTHEPINAQVIKDFLPRPEDLVFKEDKMKVTLSLSKRSVDFLKQVAKSQGTA